MADAEGAQPEWCNEASRALAEAMERASKGQPGSASPPELWLHAARAELLVLQAHNELAEQELDDEVQKMCALVEVSDLDDVDRWPTAMGARMVDQAKSAPAVTAAAKRVVQALKAGRPAQWPSPRRSAGADDDSDRG